MTAAGERTIAVIATREFLEVLVASDSGASSEVRVAAIRLLCRYPLDVDIVTSSVALPTLWTDPRSSRCRAWRSGEA
ncbi:BPSL0761 family protein [Paraburkholderia azotifigens]|uniref:BPSL0761 family protein n=1 Tax=Paraburkholderia azotifigens TaxID=2057004 RepID=UPI00317712A9